MPRNSIESLLETVLPGPIIDVIVALGRFVYAVLFSRSLDPDSWTASLLPPLISLVLAYASLVIAYRAVRNTFQLAWFGVKYGAIIGAAIAIYSWYKGEATAQGLGGAGRGANALLDVLDGAAGLAGAGPGGRPQGGGGMDLLRNLGIFGQGGVTLLPLVGTILGQLQAPGGVANAQGRVRANNQHNNNGRGTASRRSERLRQQNSGRGRQGAQRGGAAPREIYADHPALFPHDPEYLPHRDNDEADDDDERAASDGEDVALRAVKHVLRWLTDTSADDDRRAGRRRAGANTNPLFRDAPGRSSSTRRRRRRSPSILDELD